MLTAPVSPAVARRRNVQLQAALILGGWTAFGLFSFSQVLLYNAVSGAAPLPWRPLPCPRLP